MAVASTSDQRTRTVWVNAKSSSVGRVGMAAARAWYPASPALDDRRPRRPTRENGCGLPGDPAPSTAPVQPHGGATMRTTREKLIDGLERRLTWRNAALAAGLFVLSNLALGSYILPSIQARRPEALDDGFLVMIDRSPLL